MSPVMGMLTGMSTLRNAAGRLMVACSWPPAGPAGAPEQAVVHAAGDERAGAVVSGVCHAGAFRSYRCARTAVGLLAMPLKVLTLNRPVLYRPAAMLVLTRPALSKPCQRRCFRCRCCRCRRASMPRCRCARVADADIRVNR